MLTFFGKSSLFDIWGDFIVYRNLVPADQRLPAIGELRQRLSLQSPNLPRKTDSDYAQVVAEQLRQARRLELPGAALQRLVFIGDTRLLDATAFQNLCAAGGWQGWAFIGRDEMGAATLRCGGEWRVCLQPLVSPAGFLRFSWQAGLWVG